MLHIIVWNLFSIEIRNSSKLRKIVGAINKAILSIPELGLEKTDISYSFPEDPSVAPRNHQLEGCSVVIIVEMFFDRPEITSEIRQRLAVQIVQEFSNAIDWPRDPLGVKAVVKRFNYKKDGFAHI